MGAQSLREEEFQELEHLVKVCVADARLTWMPPIAICLRLSSECVTLWLVFEICRSAGIGSENVHHERLSGIFSA